MRETIEEICDALDADGADVNQKLAMIGAVLESIMVHEVQPGYRAEAVDRFCGLVRSRVPATLN